MDGPDPVAPLTCPICAAPLRHVATKASLSTTALYACLSHGLFKVSVSVERVDPVDD